MKENTRNQEKKITTIKEILSIIMILSWIGIKVVRHFIESAFMPLLTGFVAMATVYGIAMFILNKKLKKIRA